VSDHPLYSDSGFWQFLAAGLALVLSQCPPVRYWLKRAKLAVECYDRIALNEEIGAPLCTWHLAITNTGGREVRVQKISLTLARGQDRKELNVRGYFEKMTDQQATLLTPFRLKPSEEWSHAVNFILMATREARQTFSAAAKAIKDDIVAKRATSDQLVEADPTAVQPLLTLFDASFFWRAGEYEVTLNVETNTPKANLSRSFRFTLFESESDQLRAHRDELKFGNGVFFRSSPVDPHFADVHQVV
jgi:hypothetical protein